LRRPGFYAQASVCQFKSANGVVTSDRGYDPGESITTQGTVGEQGLCLEQGEAVSDVFKFLIQTIAMVTEVVLDGRSEVQSLRFDDVSKQAGLSRDGNLSWVLALLSFKVKVYGLTLPDRPLWLCMSTQGGYLVWTRRRAAIYRR